MTVWVKEVATNAMRWPQPRARPRIICNFANATYLRLVLVQRARRGIAVAPEISVGLCVVPATYAVYSDVLDCMPSRRQAGLARDLNAAQSATYLLYFDGWCRLVARLRTGPISAGFVPHVDVETITDALAPGQETSTTESSQLIGSMSTHSQQQIGQAH